MRAVVMEAVRQPLILRSDWDIEPMGPVDALVAVKATGICRSDWHLWQGHWGWMGVELTLPAVLGHETSGVIVATGRGVRAFREGDRVVIPFVRACGTCRDCAEGRENICSRGWPGPDRGDGGFAEYKTVRNADANLVRLPATLSHTEAASLGCRFATAYRGVVQRGQIAMGEWLVVFGCGGLGLAAVTIGSCRGAMVIAVSRTISKLEQARECGALYTLCPSDDYVHTIRDMTHGGAHMTVDCVGAASIGGPSLECLRPTGRCVRLGLSGSEEQGLIGLPVDMLVSKELSVHGSYGLASSGYSDVLHMVVCDRLLLSRLVTSVVTLDDVPHLLAAMNDPTSAGIVVASVS